MIRLRPLLILGASAAAIAPAIVAAPASAQVVTSDPAQFVDSLTKQGFQVLRSGDKASAKAKFHSLLGQYFAIDEIGDRLIRRWRPTITPAQYAAYKAALPDFLIGTYADNLYDYANADLKVLRAVPRGDSAAVLTQVTKPGQSPINAVWQVDKIGGGYKVSNLTVAGVNLSLTQTADFDAYVQRNGFDKLVAFMKSRN